MLRPPLLALWLGTLALAATTPQVVHSSPSASAPQSGAQGTASTPEARTRTNETLDLHAREMRSAHLGHFVGGGGVIQITTVIVVLLVVLLLIIIL